MRYVYTIFIFLTALLISTGCGLIQKAQDALPDGTATVAEATPEPSATPTANPDSDTGIHDSPGFVDGEVAEVEEVVATPTPTPTPEHVCVPAEEHCYYTARTNCLMSVTTNEDSDIRSIVRYDIYTWSNGDQAANAVLLLNFQYRSAGSWAAEKTYLAGENVHGGLLDFKYDGHSVEAEARGFRIWTDGRTLHAEEPGVWSAQKELACAPASY